MTKAFNSFRGQEPKVEAIFNECMNICFSESQSHWNSEWYFTYLFSILWSNLIAHEKRKRNRIPNLESAEEFPCTKTCLWYYWIAYSVGHPVNYLDSPSYGRLSFDDVISATLVTSHREETPYLSLKNNYASFFRQKLFAADFGANFRLEHDAVLLQQIEASSHDVSTPILLNDCGREVSFLFLSFSHWP